MARTHSKKSKPMTEPSNTKKAAAPKKKTQRKKAVLPNSRQSKKSTGRTKTPTPVPVPPPSLVSTRKATAPTSTPIPFPPPSQEAQGTSIPMVTPALGYDAFLDEDTGSSTCTDNSRSSNTILSPDSNPLLACLPPNNISLETIVRQGNIPEEVTLQSVHDALEFNKTLFGNETFTRSLRLLCSITDGHQNFKEACESRFFFGTC